jgi:hypothetical protein
VCLDRWYLRIHRLDEIIVQPAGEVMHESAQVLLKYGRERLEQRQPTAPRPTDSAIQPLPSRMKRIKADLRVCLISPQSALPRQSCQVVTCGAHAACG